MMLSWKGSFTNVVTTTSNCSVWSMDWYFEFWHWQRRYGDCNYHYQLNYLNHNLFSSCLCGHQIDFGMVHSTHGHHECIFILFHNFCIAYYVLFMVKTESSVVFDGWFIHFEHDYNACICRVRHSWKVTRIHLRDHFQPWSSCQEFRLIHLKLCDVLHTQITLQAALQESAVKGPFANSILWCIMGNVPLIFEEEKKPCDRRIFQWDKTLHLS